MFIRKASPQLVTVHNPAKAYNGYTLFGTNRTRDIWLVNMDGNIVQHWQRPGLSGIHARLLPNGNLLTGVEVPTGPMVKMPCSEGILVELDWDSNVVWKYEDLNMNGHDWERLANGNTLVAHWEPIPADIAAKIKGGIPGTEWNGVILGDYLREITPDGKVVWEWKAYEHMDLERDIMCPLCPRHTWSYINSLVTLPDGNILLSMRQINTIAIIDRHTGEFKWKWGMGELGHQHDATMLDNGNILVFDNGSHRRNIGSEFAYSRVLEVNPKTDKVEWEYYDKNKASFFSPLCSGTQRLPNGNTLICEATKGRIFEVSPEKEIVWEFFNPFYIYKPTYIFGLTNVTYRAYRYSHDYKGLKGKTLDPEGFEWALQKKGMPGVAQVSTSQTGR